MFEKLFPTHEAKIFSAFFTLACSGNSPLAAEQLFAISRVKRSRPLGFASPPGSGCRARARTEVRKSHVEITSSLPDMRRFSGMCSFAKRGTVALCIRQLNRCGQLSLLSVYLF